MSSSASVSSKFAAFSDPTRLRILHILRDGEICVGDLVTILGLPQPTVSRHLGYLRRAGLVTTEKRGLWVFYDLASATSGAHKKLIECLGACFSDVPDLRKDARRAKKIRRSGGCCPK